MLIGFVFRSTFITQGFNATDEGWLQSVGRRITLGQIPYRDFDFIFPPVSIYKEAGLEVLLGDSYTLLAARWVFVAEAMHRCADPPSVLLTWSDVGLPRARC